MSSHAAAINVTDVPNANVNPSVPLEEQTPENSPNVYNAPPPPKPRVCEYWPFKAHLVACKEACDFVIETMSQDSEIKKVYLDQVSEIVMKKIHDSPASGTIVDARSQALHNCIANIFVIYNAIFLGGRVHELDDDGVPLEPFEYRPAYKAWMEFFVKIFAMPVPKQFVEKFEAHREEVKRFQKFAVEPGLIKTIHEDMQTRREITELYWGIQKTVREIDEFEREERRIHAEQLSGVKAARARAALEAIEKSTGVKIADAVAGDKPDAEVDSSKPTFAEQFATFKEEFDKQVKALEK